eukprot:TRINITY_DN28768_c0_g1_i1.p1 TRINITY_DN28768_c0_g1~~TRINITY_DN28768_c0_g1_i1.p1  ORF type:complete len:286 (-),score=39.11 TRINITY_DN28768_c0_g1_i1:127-984(-)
MRPIPPWAEHCAAKADDTGRSLGRLGCTGRAPTRCGRSSSRAAGFGRAVPLYGGSCYARDFRRHTSAPQLAEQKSGSSPTHAPAAQPQPAASSPSHVRATWHSAGEQAPVTSLYTLDFPVREVERPAPRRHPPPRAPGGFKGTSTYKNDFVRYQGAEKRPPSTPAANSPGLLPAASPAKAERSTYAADFSDDAAQNFKKRPQSAPCGVAKHGDGGFRSAGLNRFEGCSEYARACAPNQVSQSGDNRPIAGLRRRLVQPSRNEPGSRAGLVPEAVARPTSATSVVF